MEYKICVSTDKGTVKEVNQDAAIVKVAATKSHGRILFAVMCDGMGGLSCGEVASSMAVKRFENWFLTELPGALAATNATERLDGPETDGGCIDEIAREWNILAQDINNELIAYGNSNCLKLGTTVVCAIVIGDEFLIMNIGDSRAYLIDDNEVSLITHDQSLVQDMIDRGVMTPEQAEESTQKSVLLQCLGAAGSVSPQLIRGEITSPASLILCSDGFWRKLYREDLLEAAATAKDKDEPEMKAELDRLIELVKSRGETDNITAVEIGFLKC